MANEKGIANITRRELCERVGCSEGSFSHYMQMSFAAFIDALIHHMPCEIDPKGVSRHRANPFERRAHILAAAVELALKIGVESVTHRKVAEYARVSSSLIAHHFEEIEHLRNLIRVFAEKNKVEGLE